jgi:hypothetical protein
MAAADAGSRSSVPLYICSVAEGEFLERHVVLLAIQFINLIRWLEMRLEASTIRCDKEKVISDFFSIQSCQIYLTQRF